MGDEQKIYSSDQSCHELRMSEEHQRTERDADADALRERVQSHHEYDQKHLVPVRAA